MAYLLTPSSSHSSISDLVEGKEHQGKEHQIVYARLEAVVEENEDDELEDDGRDEDRDDQSEVTTTSAAAVAVPPPPPPTSTSISKSTRKRNAKNRKLVDFKERIAELELQLAGAGNQQQVRLYAV
jgi:hypothetical protein